MKKVYGRFIIKLTLYDTIYKTHTKTSLLKLDDKQILNNFISFIKENIDMYYKPVIYNNNLKENESMR